jgi:hypothetical protein
MKKVLLLVVLSCLFAGCIQEFIPAGINEERGILVIDGMIQNGESIFRLSWTVGISEELDGSEFINDAEVYVESNDGIRIPAVFSGVGTYIAQTPVLDTLREYRLVATIKDETCESGFLKPTISTEIDSIFPVKRRNGGPVEICVAAHDPADRSSYYRWQYREAWEVKTELYANGRYENGKFIPHSRFTSENTYRCWGRDSSKVILIASTEKLSESRITQQTLVTIPCRHDRLSILYHIEVEQMQLREAAYRYFADVKERAERTGDIFSPVLTSGLRGNIYWRDNPEGLIIGYIEVATVTAKDRYIWEREGFYEFPGNNCYPDSEFNYWWRGGASFFEREAPNVYLSGLNSANIKCVDCRLKEKATKLKPSGWPTDSL